MPRLTTNESHQGKTDVEDTHDLPWVNFFIDDHIVFEDSPVWCYGLPNWIETREVPFFESRFPLLAPTTDTPATKVSSYDEADGRGASPPPTDPSPRQKVMDPAAGRVGVETRVSWTQCRNKHSSWAGPQVFWSYIGPRLLLV